MKETLMDTALVVEKLYAEKMHPPDDDVASSVSLVPETVCVWDASGALATRNVSGPRQLVRVLTCSPGCCSPCCYHDMLSHYRWLHHTLQNFNWFTIIKITNHKFEHKTSTDMYETFEDSNKEETLAYRDALMMRSNNTQCRLLMYNLTNLEDVHLYCMTLELVNAFAAAQMLVRHQCKFTSYGVPCYICQKCLFHAAMFMMFSVKCSLELYGGYFENMTLLYNMEWKWEKGSYYEEVFLTYDEYRGPSFMIPYGYAPLMPCVPENDIWTGSHGVGQQQIIESYGCAEDGRRGPSFMIPYGYAPLMPCVPENDIWTASHGVGQQQIIESYGCAEDGRR